MAKVTFIFPLKHTFDKYALQRRYTRIEARTRSYVSVSYNPTEPLQSVYIQKTNAYTLTDREQSNSNRMYDTHSAIVDCRFPNVKEHKLHGSTAIILPDVSFVYLPSFSL